MHITCPACATRYAVADSSIGADGRVVRCAKCRHSWFQDPPEPAEPDAETPGVPVPAMPEPAPWPEAAPAQQWPEAAPRQGAVPAPWREAAHSPECDPSPPGAALPPSAYAEDEADRNFAETPSSFAHEPPFRPRRRRAMRWLIAALLVLLVAIAAMGAMARFGVPDWLPLPHGALAQAEGAFGAAAPDLVLDFPPDRQRARPLPNGSDFFNVSGSIRNTAGGRRAVPTLRILLRDGHNNIVYSLETAAPKPMLAPGETETVDQAIIDAPSAARSAEIGWKPR